MDVQWPFGHGLSYTAFAYSNMTVDKAEFNPEEVLTVSVDVTNTESVAGKESVLLFSTDMYATCTPDVRRLREFTKVELAPGETKTVTFESDSEHKCCRGSEHDLESVKDTDLVLFLCSSFIVIFLILESDSHNNTPITPTAPNIMNEYCHPSNQAFLDIVSGVAEPYGLLPLQLPKDMKTVEEQFEDVGRDMDCYVDADGNSYDFAFGLNWNGVIDDWRVEKYK